MNRIDCSLDKLGQVITNRLYYNTLKSLPLSTHGLLTSGFYGNIYIGTSQKNGPRSIKKLDKNNGRKMVHSSKKNFIVKVMNDTKNNRSDINRLIITQRLVRGNICPHFPLVYGYFRLDNAEFFGQWGNGITKINDIDVKVKHGKATGYIMENLGDITMERYIYSKIDKSELRQILFQLYVSIHALIKHTGMNHGDFHFKNVMLIKVKPENYHYQIDDISYKVHVKQYLPIIIDLSGNAFGGEKVNGMKDIRHFNTYMNRFIPNEWKALQIRKTNVQNVKKFIEINFENYETDGLDLSILNNRKNYYI